MSELIYKFKSLLRDMKRYLPIVLHYGHSVVLSMGTIWFGIFLLLNYRNNVIERVDIFPEGVSEYYATVMLIMGSIKLLSVFKPDNKVKKWSLIGITLLWLVIAWAYVVNRSQNTGFIMAATLAASCYVELWRGDYRDDR